MTDHADRPVLLAYVHLQPGTPHASAGLLRDYVTDFAEREGYDLHSVVVGMQNQSEPMTVRTLIHRVRATGAKTVLVTGPARAALEALQHLGGIRILTLADADRSRRAAS